MEALAAVAYEAGLQFEDVMVALGCRGPTQITPDGSAVCGAVQGLLAGLGEGESSTC